MTRAPEIRQKKTKLLHSNVILPFLYYKITMHLINRIVGVVHFNEACFLSNFLRLLSTIFVGCPISFFLCFIDKSHFVIPVQYQDILVHPVINIRVGLKNESSPCNNLVSLDLYNFYPIIVSHRVLVIKQIQ